MATRWYRIWYRATQAIFVLLFVAFSVVVPLDCIVQASSSVNDAVNTFIVVGAVVVVVVFVISISFARILFFRRSLQDIPKPYIPITEQDIPHKPSRKFVIENMKKAGTLSLRLKVPKDPVVHAGMEPENSDMFPPHLKYYDIVKFLSDRYRFDGAVLTNFSNGFDLQSTFRDAMQKLFEKEQRPYKKYVDELLDLYEKFRFSGQQIQRDEFIRFVRLYAYLVELSKSFDNAVQDSSLSPFSRVGTGDYDSDTRSQSDSEYSTTYLKPYTADSFLRTLTPASRMNSHSTTHRFELDESAEPPESIEDYQRYHDMLTRVDTYNTVIHR